MEPNKIEYDGSFFTYLRISLIALIFTVFTFGIYYFWGKTKKRKYLVSSCSLEGDRFEYSGKGKELFFGFLKAACLFFIFFIPIWGMEASVEEDYSKEDSFIALIIFLSYVFIFSFLFFIGTYGSYRYKAGHTKWRGITFGVLGNSVEYAKKGYLYSLTTILSLGILSSLYTVRMNSYKLNHTYFGKTKLNCELRFKDIFPLAIKTYFFSFFFTIFLFISFGYFSTPSQEEKHAAMQQLQTDLSNQRSAFDFKGTQELTQEQLDALTPEQKLELTKELREFEQQASQYEQQQMQQYAKPKIPFWLILLSILYLPIIAIAQFYYNYTFKKKLIESLSLGNLTLTLEASFKTFLRFQFVNFLILMITFGAAKAYIFHRRLKFYSNHVSINGNINEIPFDQGSYNFNALGEGIASFFDFEF